MMRLAPSLHISDDNDNDNDNDDDVTTTSSPSFRRTIVVMGEGHDDGELEQSASSSSSSSSEVIIMPLSPNGTTTTMRTRKRQSPTTTTNSKNTAGTPSSCSPVGSPCGTTTNSCSPTQPPPPQQQQRGTPYYMTGSNDRRRQQQRRRRKPSSSSSSGGIGGWWFLLRFCRNHSILPPSWWRFWLQLVQRRVIIMRKKPQKWSLPSLLAIIMMISFSFSVLISTLHMSTSTTSSNIPSSTNKTTITNPTTTTTTSSSSSSQQQQPQSFVIVNNNSLFSQIQSAMTFSRRQLSSSLLFRHLLRGGKGGTIVSADEKSYFQCTKRIYYLDSDAPDGLASTTSLSSSWTREKWLDRRYHSHPKVMELDVQNQYIIIDTNNNNNTANNNNNNNNDNHSLLSQRRNTELDEDHDWHPDYSKERCIPMAEWQIQSFPTCNNIHEIDIPLSSSIGASSSSSGSSTNKNAENKSSASSSTNTQEQQKHGGTTKTTTRRSLTAAGGGEEHSQHHHHHDSDHHHRHDEHHHQRRLMEQQQKQNQPHDGRGSDGIMLHDDDLLMDRLSVLGEGWFRTTWRLDRRRIGDSSEQHLTETSSSSSSSSTESHTDEIPFDSVVLKTLRIEREYIPEYYELQRRDSVAMERLTASPFIVNIYGYCGQSAINEMANFPYQSIYSLESFNKQMRGKEHLQQAKRIQLRIATSLAIGVAHIHAAGMYYHNNQDNQNQDTSHNNNNNNNFPAYMVHYDLNPRNIALFSGGKPKINDFNIAEFLKYDKYTGQTCKFVPRLHEPWWRAPEEMNTIITTKTPNTNNTALANVTSAITTTTTTSSSSSSSLFVDEKVDVYSLGNLLYHTLTTHSPRGKMHTYRISEVRPLVAAGIIPEIPQHIMDDTDPGIVAIRTAMLELCYIPDPKKRGTAKQVADLLMNTVQQLTTNNGGGAAGIALPFEHEK